MLFEFELDALEAEVSGVSMAEDEGDMDESWFDQEYFSWEMHDFFELDWSSGYKYPFQEGYSVELHPHNHSISQIEALLSWSR